MGRGREERAGRKVRGREIAEGERGKCEAMFDLDICAGAGVLLVTPLLRAGITVCDISWRD